MHHYFLLPVGVDQNRVAKVHPEAIERVRPFGAGKTTIPRYPEHHPSIGIRDANPLMRAIRDLDGVDPFYG